MPHDTDKVVLWLSPLNKCDTCINEFDGESPMYDVQIYAGGPWGNLCQSCFERFNCDVGVGRGQKYELLPIANGSAWVKTEG